MQIIIPMSGIGKRFIEAGYKDPKPLINVDGKPMIEHVINLFPNETNFSFICNDKHLRETNMKNIILQLVPNTKIYQVSIDNRQGPVHAVSQIFDKIDDNDEVIVSYCDYGTKWNYQMFLQITRDNNFDGSIAGYIGFHPHMLGTDHYAYMKTDNENNVLEIREKKPFDNKDKMEQYASNGTYYFKSGNIVKKYFQKLMDLNLSINNEFYVSMVYNLLIEDGLKVNVFEIENMLQWGTPYDLEIYQKWSNYFKKPLQNRPKDKLNTTLILPMAGKGSRFSIKGYKNPKPLLEVDGLPMVIKAVEDLPDTNNKIFICLKEHLDQYPSIKNSVETFYKNNTKIVQINNVTEGQACTCEIGINECDIDLEQPILISACDNGVYYDVNKYNQLIENSDVDVIVWSFKNNPTSKNNPDMYAWLDVDDEDNIKYVSVKKCIFDDPYNHYAIIGTMFFRKAKYFIHGLNKIYQKNIKTNGEYYVDNVLNELINDGYVVKNFGVEDYICWGTPDDYETYNYWKNYFKFYNAIF